MSPNPAEAAERLRRLATQFLDWLWPPTPAPHACQDIVWLYPDLAAFYDQRDNLFTIRCKACGHAEQVSGREIREALKQVPLTAAQRQEQP